MPARSDCRWRKTDSHSRGRPHPEHVGMFDRYLSRQAAPQPAEAGAIGGIIGDLMRGQ